MDDRKWIVDLLVPEFPSLSRDEIEAAYTRAAEEFRSATITSYVPIFALKKARQELRSLQRRKAH